MKSSTVHDFVARLTYERGHGILFTRYTMTSAELSIIPEFKITLRRLGIEDDFHITKTTVRNKRTGSFIYFSGIKTSTGDQTARLKSISGITTWIIEEGEEFKDEKVFDDIDDSIRTMEKPNRVIWIQNPSTKEHFIYKRWIEKSSRQEMVHGYRVTMSAHPDVEHIHTTYHLGEQMGYLAKSWLSKVNGARKQVEDKISQTAATWTKSAEELELRLNTIKHTSTYYYKYVGGWLERAEGVIFDNWIEGEFDSTLPYANGQDYGYSPDPYALIQVAVDKKRKRVYLKQRAYEYELDDIPAHYEGIGVNKRELIVTDTNEPRTTANIAKKGYNIQKARKHEVAEDIREMKQYLFVVDPKSNDLKAELNNYVWNDKKASVPIDDYNHLLDAMRYAYRRLVVGKKSGARKRN